MTDKTTLKIIFNILHRKCWNADRVLQNTRYSSVEGIYHLKGDWEFGALNSNK
jgi:hypothetical protein